MPYAKLVATFRDKTASCSTCETEPELDAQLKLLQASSQVAKIDVYVLSASYTRETAWATEDLIHHPPPHGVK